MNRAAQVPRGSVILGACYSCLRFLLDSLHMTWGHFQLPEEAFKTPVNYNTSSAMLPKKIMELVLAIV